VGLKLTNLDAFEIQSDQTILMSFSINTLVPGIGWVEDEDVVIFDPTSLGSNTAGTFAMFFEGDANGIQGYYTDIDAVGREVREGGE
jgi:hypothetical protein